MFYRAEEDHGLSHNPLKAIVAPRPIGWISTLSAGGVANLAPYSFFNAVSDTPPMLMFASGGEKDSLTNARATGEFTFNYASSRMTDAMNLSSGGYEPDKDEFEIAGLEKVKGETVACPRVAGVPAALECKVLDIIQPIDLSGEKTIYQIVLGQVTGVHIDDAMITDGRFDVKKADPLMRAGYRDYALVSDMFELARPPGAGGM
ncbi:flavin reductase family protein [Pseudahrensia aquimaris]|uniref:Flavin reductase family protein n=1 Tax=Pseudahrensia aquimaris TaxID=744461 RepID=A0ABW3FCD5_9HYPH